MTACASCRGLVEPQFRFCPWCGASQRSKIVELFAGHPLIEQDPGKALRVSRYLGDTEETRHVRFSVWAEAGLTPRAEAVVSLTDEEAERLARFLAETAGVPEAGRVSRNIGCAERGSAKPS
jgi:hypothetical protein